MTANKATVFKSHDPKWPMVGVTSDKHRTFWFSEQAMEVAGARLKNTAEQLQMQCWLVVRRDGEEGHLITTIEPRDADLIVTTFKPLA